MQAQVTLKACLKCSHNIGRNLVTRSRVAVRVMRSYNSAPLFGAKPVIPPFRGGASYRFTGGLDCCSDCSGRKLQRKNTLPSLYFSLQKSRGGGDYVLRKRNACFLEKRKPVPNKSTSFYIKKE